MNFLSKMKRRIWIEDVLSEEDAEEDIWTEEE
jgi:hypothetical protein